MYHDAYLIVNSLNCAQNRIGLNLHLAEGLNPQILVAVAFCDTSMKIGGETYLDLLNRSRRGAHLADLLGAPRGAPRGAPKYPQGPTRKKILSLKGGSKQLAML